MFDSSARATDGRLLALASLASLNHPRHLQSGPCKSDFSRSKTCACSGPIQGKLLGNSASWP
eukprot:598879-Alexandrium_andersonii.AAC.1